ncbi:MAG: hypothetical protein H0Z39_03570 [Peptococcaceae bacterium]|nr:hypothetical protein [Peptococcaceae bacterium]
MRLALVIAAILYVFTVTVPAAYAAVWEYTISDMDTATTIEVDKTTAVVDTSANEIRAPRFAPHTVSFWPDGSPDFVVTVPGKILHYGWDGSQYHVIEVLNADLGEDPFAVATPNPFPEVVASTKTGTYHYSFTGSEMLNNPALSAAGLSGVLAMGAYEKNKVGIADGEIRGYSYDESTGLTTRDTSLELSGDELKPIDVALFPDRNGYVVLEEDGTKTFLSTGSSMEEVPALAVSGLQSPRAVAAGENYRIAVIDRNQQKEWHFDGTQMRYNFVLSVTSGLTSPTCVALRPGTYDRIIVDGDEAKYFRFDEDTGQLVYDPQRSVSVEGLSEIGGYLSGTVVVSQPKDPGSDVSWVRVRAYHDLAPNTTVTWAVRVNSSEDWIKAWRVTKLEDGSTVCEVTADNGSTWETIGPASLAEPDSNDPATAKLWVELPVAGREVQWKAELTMTDQLSTPRIKAPVPGNVAVKWEAGTPPEQPFIDTPSSCYLTSTPVFNWSFIDPDPGDYQTAYQVVIRKKSDGTVIYDSGKVMSPEESFRLPTSADPATPGPLWVSGEYEFTVEVRVWDSMDIPSEWSPSSDFCVIAFERPRVAEIGSAPAGEPDPDPGDPATHLVIREGMTVENLPVVKAGSLVGLLIDSIGPIDSASATFPYNGREAHIDSGPTKQLPDTNRNRWLVEFWTDASLDITPDGTAVEMQLRGNSPEGTITLDAPPYADGVVRTQGTVYHDWLVHLKGRK